MPCSERFPSMINNNLMTRCVTWLVCSSTGSHYNELKQKKHYSNQYLGFWYGDQIQIIGDYEEELSHSVNENYKDITLEVIAMLFENDDELIQEYIEDSCFFDFLAEVALLDNAPMNLIFTLSASYGKEWKQEYYKRKT